MSKALAALQAALILALAVALAATGPALAQTETATLTVTGEGQLRAAPDIATIRAGVETEGRTAAEALAANNARAGRMIETLKAAGVAAGDIQTGRLSVEPYYADMQRTRPGEPPEIVGYRVVNEVGVTVRDLDALGGLLDQVVRAGANRINAIGFGIAEDTAQADEARRRAVADARRRAEVLAEAAGVRLARVISISEGGGVVRPMPGVMMRAEAMDVPIERGEVEIAARVTLVWEIAPAEE
ncbi:MAG TPA: SIMPL domain-containing protein [Thermohalobaculum sp.]|nr:SIMPL domain-containing protein [Thermohalobaculum sp.]